MQKVRAPLLFFFRFFFFILTSQAFEGACVINYTALWEPADLQLFSDEVESLKP